MWPKFYVFGNFSPFLVLFFAKMKPIETHIKYVHILTLFLRYSEVPELFWSKKFWSIGRYFQSLVGFFFVLFKFRYVVKFLHVAINGEKVLYNYWSIDFWWKHIFLLHILNIFWPVFLRKFGTLDFGRLGVFWNLVGFGFVLFQLRYRVSKL